MEIACQASYPLNSENARPPGTFTLYLSCLSCAEMAKPPKTPSQTVVAMPIIDMLWRFIAAPPALRMSQPCTHRSIRLNPRHSAVPASDPGDDLIGSCERPIELPTMGARPSAHGHRRVR